MARIEPATSGLAGLHARVGRKIAKRITGREMDSVDVLARHPRLLRAYGSYDRQIEKDGHLDHRLKSLAVLKAAAVVECEFCMDIGSEFARRAGLSDEQLLGLARPRESGAFTDLEADVAELAASLSRTPAAVDDEQAERVRRALGDEAFMELVTAIAWENHRARLNVALDLAPEGFSEGKVCVMPEGGADASAPASPVVAA